MTDNTIDNRITLKLLEAVRQRAASAAESHRREQEADDRKSRQRAAREAHEWQLQIQYEEIIQAAEYFFNRMANTYGLQYGDITIRDIEGSMEVSVIGYPAVLTVQYQPWREIAPRIDEFLSGLRPSALEATIEQAFNAGLANIQTIRASKANVTG